MNEIVNGMKVIKMYTWEKAFASLVAASRKLEMNQIRDASHLRGIIIAFLHFITRLAIFTSVVTLVLVGENPSAYYVFMISSFFNSLRVIMTAHLPEGLMQLAELNVSVKRIQEFLLLEEKEEKEAIIDLPQDLTVSIENGATKWNATLGDDTLHNINLQLHKSETIAIIGRVGSGKTTLLQVVLKELPLNQGKITTTNNISYTPQEPWIFSGTIRQNILLGQKFDEKKYTRVVKACALQRDFALLPRGDRTPVGERGVTLSGGQKARINLARAVYRDADVYLLDDPLSAVDAQVGKQIFHDCIRDYLKNKSVVLVTHQTQYLGDVDRVVVLENGKISVLGHPKEIKIQDYLLSDGDVEVKDEEQQMEYGEMNEVKEQRSYGDISKRVYHGYIKAGGGFCAAFVVMQLFAYSQIFASGADYFVTFW